MTQAKQEQHGAGQQRQPDGGQLFQQSAVNGHAQAGARGVVFQLCESLGVLSRRPIEDQLAKLGDDDRKALARLGVRVGVYSIYFPSMLKPVPIRLRAGLWMIARNRETIPPLPAEGRTSMDLPKDAERDFYATIGYSGFEGTVGGETHKFSTGLFSSCAPSTSTSPDPLTSMLCSIGIVTATFTP